MIETLLSILGITVATFTNLVMVICIFTIVFAVGGLLPLIGDLLRGMYELLFEVMPAVAAEIFNRLRGK